MVSYLVCEFTEEDGTLTVEIVPATWYNEKAGRCSWPSTNGSSYAKRQRLPMPSWQTYEAKLLYRTSDYDQATRHRNNLLSNSEYQTTDDERPRKRTAPVKYMYIEEIRKGTKECAPEPARKKIKGPTQMLGDITNESTEEAPEKVIPVSQSPIPANSTPRPDMDREEESQSSSEESLFPTLLAEPHDSPIMTEMKKAILELTKKTDLLIDISKQTLDRIKLLESKQMALEQNFMEKLNGIQQVSMAASTIEEADRGSIAIKMMASSKAEIRAKTSYKECLSALGYPVTTTLEDLISSDLQFLGSEKETLRRRNALINSLKEMAPPADDGQGNLKNTARSCLYAIAPVHFWQYFTSQGRSSATKFSLLEDMPHCYQAIITVCAQLSRLPQQTIVTALANVMKSCRHRVASKNYRRLHPELGLVDATLLEERENSLQGFVDLGTVDTSLPSDV